MQGLAKKTWSSLTIEKVEKKISSEASEESKIRSTVP